MTPSQVRVSPRGTRQLRRAAIGVLLWMAGVSAGCGQQADADYLGKPLLSMRGQATVSALTDGQALVPALCFFGAAGAAAPFDENKLPADIRADLPNAMSTFPFLYGPPQTGSSILDVQSRGEFPAQFDVAVYLPPVAAALKPPLFDGEPHVASGYVCGVSTGHAALTHQLDRWQIIHCNDTTACYRESVLASYDTPRFYFERYDCPVGDGSADGEASASQHVLSSDHSDCKHTTGGDQSLPYEIAAESVLGYATDLILIYLDSAAAAGSYTAWQYGGSPTGLSAGYHLFANPPGPPPPESEAESTCLSNAFTDAEAMIQAKYGPEITQLYGDGYVINMFPIGANGPDGIKPLPADVVKGGQRIWVKLQMQRCPPIPLREIDPATTKLSIQIGPQGSQQMPTPSQPDAGTAGSML